MDGRNRNRLVLGVAVAAVIATGCYRGRPHVKSPFDDAVCLNRHDRPVDVEYCATDVNASMGESRAVLLYHWKPLDDVPEEVQEAALAMGARGHGQRRLISPPHDPSGGAQLSHNGPWAGQKPIIALDPTMRAGSYGYYPGSGGMSLNHPQ